MLIDYNITVAVFPAASNSNHNKSFEAESMTFVGGFEKNEIFSHPFLSIMPPYQRPFACALESSPD